MNPLIPLLLIGSGVFVYFDATRNKIGKISDEKGMFNMSAGGWAIGSIWLWIVFFPSYISKRKSLIEKAKNNPVEAPLRNLKLVVLVAFCLLATGKALQQKNKVNKAKESVQKALGN